MKAIRYIASILLLAAGVIHLLLFIQDPAAKGSAVVLAFGIIYLVIGILLALKIKYSVLSGIIFPLIGTIAGLTLFDPAELTLLLKILGIIDAVVIVLCSILLWGSRRKAA